MFQRAADPPTTPTDSAGLSLRGFLKKMGGMRLGVPKWQYRFVVIDQGVLQYYLEKWEADTPPPPAKSAAPLPLEAIRVHCPPRPRGKLMGLFSAEFAFEIEAGGKSFIFCASTAREKQLWIQTLRSGSALPSPAHATPPPGPGAPAGAPESEGGGVAPATRQPLTQLEATKAAVAQEYDFLYEGLQRIAEDSPEYSATLALIDSIRPFIEKEQLASNNDA